MRYIYASRLTTFQMTYQRSTKIKILFGNTTALAFLFGRSAPCSDEASVNWTGMKSSFPHLVILFNQLFLTS